MTTSEEEEQTDSLEEQPSDNNQASSDREPESEQVNGLNSALVAAAQQWKPAADSDLSKPATADDTSTEPLLKSDLVRGNQSVQEPSTDESHHAHLLIMLCLASIACAAFMPYSTFAAGVSRWVALHGRTSWFMFNLIAALVMPVVVMAQFYLDNKYNVMFGASAAYAFRLCFGVVGSAVIVGSMPWAAKESVELFYLYALIYPVFTMCVSGAISQITSYMTADMIAYLCTGRSMPAFLVLILVVAFKYDHDADFESAGRFHIAAAILIVCCGATYLLLPKTTAIRLILRLESSEKLEGPTSFWQLTATTRSQILVCLVSSLVFQAIVVSAPLLPSSQQTGQLAQQVVLTGITLDVVGKLSAAGPLGSLVRGSPSVLPVLCAVNVCVPAVILPMYFTRTPASLQHDLVPCLVAGVACSGTGFLFTVANQVALELIPLHQSAQLMCIFNLVIAISCILVSSTLLMTQVL